MAGHRKIAAKKVDERHLSDMSEGGPVGSTAFKEERETFSASNSTGPGRTWMMTPVSILSG